MASLRLTDVNHYYSKCIAIGGSIVTSTVIATIKYEFTTTNSLQRAIPCKYREFFFRAVNDVR